MKYLTLVRHAKSSWKDTTINDLQRPIKKSGKKNASIIAADFNKQKLKVDFIITSPALRTFDTALIYAAQLKYSKEKIAINKDIYETGYRELLTVLTTQDNLLNHIMLVGHDPSLCDLFNFLTTKTLEKIPTSCCTTLKFSIKKWKELEKTKGEISYFNFPKKYKVSNNE